MKSIFILFSLFLVSQGFTLSDPATVSHVDIDSYMGRWYEIARLPNSFQRNCGATRATYTLLDSGKVKVHNECLKKKNGKLKSIIGYAIVKDKKTNAKLGVSFIPLLKYFTGYWGDYWILDLEQNYQYALVGSPDRKYLWILARDKHLSPSVLWGLVERARTLGYDVKSLVATPQWGLH